MNKVLKFLKSLPGKVIFYFLLGFTIVIILLQFLAKSTSTRAKEMNLGALIQDAIDKLKIKQNKEKIEELEKEPKKEDLETDPNKVIDFYKNRDKK